MAVEQSRLVILSRTEPAALGVNLDIQNTANNFFIFSLDFVFIRCYNIVILSAKETYVQKNKSYYHK